MLSALSRVLRAGTALVLACLASVPGACQTNPSDAPPPTLTLDDAVRLALADNPQLQAGAGDVGKAAAAAASARADLLPVVRLQAVGGALLDPLNVRIPAGSLGAVNQAPFPSQDALVYSERGGIGLVTGTIAQPLTQLPIIRLNIQAQQVGVRVAQEQQRGRRQAVAAGVRQTYYQLLETQDSLDAARQTLAYDLELERTVGDFVSHRTALQADLLDAQAQTARQRLTLTQLTDTEADAHERLNSLLGRDLMTPFVVVMPANGPASPDDAPALRERALRQRPDVREAALYVEQAALGRRIAQAPNLPAVSLVLSDSQLAGRVHGLPDQLGILGLQLDWVPLDWGRRQAAQEGQSQQVAQAQAALQDARLQALLDVDARTRQYAEAQAALLVAQAGVQAAQERLREMTNQYKDRAILLKDVLQQQAAAADADARERQAMDQLLAARAALATAVGDDE